MPAEVIPKELLAEVAQIKGLVAQLTEELRAQNRTLGEANQLLQTAVEVLGKAGYLPHSPENWKYWHQVAKPLAGRLAAFLEDAITESERGTDEVQSWR